MTNSAEVEIDRQGRMPIPAHLRSFAGLDAEVLVHGAIDRVELWNPAAWANAARTARGELAPRGRRGLGGRTGAATQTTNGTSPTPTTETATTERTILRNTTDGTHWTMCSSSTGVLEDHSTRFPAGRPDLHLPLDPPAEGLQMAHSFEHIPVLRDEVVSLFATVPSGVVVDATGGWRRSLGGIAAGVSRPARGSGLDRDAQALAAARRRSVSFGDRVTLIRSPFSALEEVVSASGVAPLSGVLFDLGVSSPQLDQAARGFSFRQDGPLDMRMDPARGVTTAADRERPARRRAARRSSARTERVGCPGASPGRS